VLRNLKHWGNSGISIIIADGSDTDGLRFKIPEADGVVQYFHNTGSVEYRLGVASAMKRTGFVLLSGDDGIFVKSGVLECLKALERDSNLGICSGTAHGFTKRGRVVLGFPIWKELKQSGQLLDISPSKRLHKHFQSYACSTIYAVQRSEIWKCTVSTVEGVNSLPANLLELFFEMSSVIQGRSEVIDNLLCLRNRENRSQWTADSSVLYWCLQPRNKDRTIIFKRDTKTSSYW
jgi:glycosyltransferase domain-containing protein